MPRETQSERVRRVAESRARPRVKVHSLAYVELGDGNAGLILNISETGMAVQAVQMLTSSHLPKIQFRLPKTETLIEASGKVIWQVRSKKEAGIAFAGLSDTSRAAITEWISIEQSRIASSAAAEQQKAEQELEATPFPSQYSSERPSSSGTVMNSSAPEPPADAQKETEMDADSTEENDEPSSIPEEPVHRVQPAGRIQTPPAPPQRGVPTHWRADAASATDAGRESRYRERTPFERAPAMPRWNGSMAPGVGMEFKKSRRWWTYTATLGLLAAVGFAGLMAIDPGLISRARIDALTHESSRVASDEQAADQNSSAAGQSNSPAEKTSPDSSGAPVPANTSSPSSPQTPPSTKGQQGPSANEAPPAALGSSSPTNANGAGTAARPRNDAGAETRHSHSSETATRTPARNQSETPYRDRGQQSSRAQEGRGRDRQEASSSAPTYGRTPATGSRTSQAAENMSQPESKTSPPAYNGNRANAATAAQGGSASATRQSASSANTREGGRNPQASAASGNGQVQQPARTSEGQSPMDTYRAQTAQPPASELGSRSQGAAGSQQPAVRSQPVQDAYARSVPYAPPRSSSASRGAASASGVAVVAVPSYQSSPVPPSMPLAGVPSGSVAATSQFRAVLIPASLAWTRSQLPSNLQMGQLISSYSPAYPIEAAREGIEGTVKLEVTVGTDGTVRSVHVLSGPAMLSSAAVSAVRDWRYAETFLASRAVETEHYVSMVFRLASAR
jgi:TonB family protein